MNASCTVITIDGPSGAGKGTVCTLVARALGFSLLDSGALYRLTALSSLNNAVDLTSEVAVADTARHLDVCFRVSGNDLSAPSVAVVLAGEDVSAAIREEHVGMSASIVAAYPKVREALLNRQRGFAQAPGLVADGRDMGTVVFPDANVKIFLTASAEVRARRRCLQLQSTGESPDFQEVLADIEARDKRDSSRSAAPLKPAEDAYLLDSTHLTIDQVVSRVLERVG